MKRTCRTRIYFVAFILLVACSRHETPSPATGDPVHGKALIAQYGCNSCHMIPGIDGARGEVGPSLDHVGTRQLIAEKLPNNLPNLMRYLQNPQMVDPQNSMPSLGIKPDEARDIAAYLYTLK